MIIWKPKIHCFISSLSKKTCNFKMIMLYFPLFLFEEILCWFLSWTHGCTWVENPREEVIWWLSQKIDDFPNLWVRGVWCCINVIEATTIFCIPYLNPGPLPLWKFTWSPSKRFFRSFVRAGQQKKEMFFCHYSHERKTQKRNWKFGRK